MSEPKKIIAVWDPLVRIGHWLLVAAFFTAYLTEGEVMPLHSWAGYTVAVVVLVRIAWGFVGTKHARFRDFIYSPKAVLGYLSGLVKGKTQHYVGHNPAGGAMVVALLASLIMTAYSGMALYAIEEGEGPLADYYAQDHVVPQPTFEFIASAQAKDSDDEDEMEDDDHHHAKSEHEHEHEHEDEDEAFWEEIHEFFANFTLLLVFLHIGGVVISSRVDKEKLVKAMITGKKEIN